MRLQMRLGQVAMTAGHMLQQDYQDEYHGAKVQLGHVLKRALDDLSSSDAVDWKNVDKMSYKFFKSDELLDSIVAGTTLNLTQDTFEKISELQNQFVEIFGTQRIYRPFVIKLIFVAALIKRKDQLV